MNKFLIVALMVLAPVFSMAVNHEEEVFNVSAIDGEVIPFTVKLFPQAPKPYENVDIELVSFRINLDRSNISWFINGTLYSSDLGKKKFSFDAGRAGSLSSVDVVVVTEDDERFAQTIDIRPAGVGLLWQAETYTPPFYKGRALPSSDATIKIISVPNIVNSRGGVVGPQNLAYKWKVGNKFDLENSGIGASSITIKGPKINNFIFVGVEVTTLDGSIKASGSIHISAGEPKLIFYEQAPLLGVKYENALNKTFDLEGNEVVIKAEPYFFSNDDSVDYQWVLNNKKIEVGIDEWNSLTLTKENNESGSAKVGLNLGAVERVLQFTNNSLIINFGEKASNFFGF